MDDMYLHKMAKAKIDTLKLLDGYIEFYTGMKEIKDSNAYHTFVQTLKDIRESLDK